MIFASRRIASIALASTFGVLLAPVFFLRAADHLVAPADLHQAIVESAESRAGNLKKVQGFFASDTVRTKLAVAGFDVKKVETALPQLSNEELRRLANQTQKIEAEVSAGALNNQQITYIIIALATAVVILIVVAA